MLDCLTSYIDNLILFCMYIVSRNIAGNAIEYAYGANGNVTYGNNRNHANYYAYGLPVQESEVKDPDPYLYSGKEFY